MEFHKYMKIKVLGHMENIGIFSDPNDDIVIQEKIDGGNFRFYISNDNVVIIGSRTQQLTSSEGEDINMNKMFLRCSNWVREKLKNKDLTKYQGMIFYGENCVKHTISYNWETIPPFLGFDIMTDNGFLKYEDVNRIYNELDLQMVPLIKICKANEIKKIDDNMVPQSVYADLTNKDIKAEGLVFKNYKKQLFGKYVRDAFKEKNADVFGGNPKYNASDDTNNSDFIYKYCTNARIDKMIFKLVDEGLELEMKLMEFLPKRIYDDIFEEEWREICYSRWKIDFNLIRKLITKRCVSVLKSVIVNNTLNGGK